MNSTIESEKNATAPEAPQPKTKRTTAKKAKPAKKAGRAKKAAGKPKADRANKKAEVIALMKRAKGATLAEIMAATELAGAHRAGLRQHPGQQGRGEDRVVQERRGRTDVQDREIAPANSPSKRRLGHAPGRRFCLCRPSDQVTSRTGHVTAQGSIANPGGRLRGRRPPGSRSWGRKRPWWRFGQGGRLWLPAVRKPRTGKIWRKERSLSGLRPASGFAPRAPAATPSRGAFGAHRGSTPPQFPA